MSKQLQIFELQDGRTWTWFKRSILYYRRTLNSSDMAMYLWYWSDIFKHFGFGPSIRVNYAEILVWNEKINRLSHGYIDW